MSTDTDPHWLETFLWVIGVFLFSIGLLLFVTVWRAHFLRFLAVESVFWKRLGVPQQTFSSLNRMIRGRAFMILCAAMTALSFIMLVAALVLYFHFQR